MGVNYRVCVFTYEYINECAENIVVMLLPLRCVHKYVCYVPLKSLFFERMYLGYRNKHREIYLRVVWNPKVLENVPSQTCCRLAHLFSDLKKTAKINVRSVSPTPYVAVPKLKVKNSYFALCLILYCPLCHF